MQGAIASCSDSLGHELVEQLAALPQSAAIGPDSTAWHGSPVSDVLSFLPEPQPEDSTLLEDVTDARLYIGHTHLPFMRFAPEGVELVNPGSVGMPFDGNPRAAYALLHDDGTVQHRRVHYDHASAARKVREQARGAIWGETVGKRIERAQFLVR